MFVTPPGDSTPIYGARLPSYDEAKAIKTAIQTAAQDPTCTWQQVAEEIWSQIQSEPDLSHIKETINSIVQGGRYHGLSDFHAAITQATVQGDKWVPQSAGVMVSSPSKGDPDLDKAITELQQWLQNNPNDLPGQDFGKAVLGEMTQVKQAGGTLADVQSWVTGGNGLYDLQFFQKYGKDGQISAGDVTTFLGFMNLQPPAFLQEYLNTVASGWLVQQQQSSTGYPFALELVHLMQQNQGSSVADIQQKLEAQIVDKLFFFPEGGAGLGYNLDVTDFTATLNKIDLKAPDYAAEYLWMGNMNQDSGSGNFGPLITPLLNQMIGYLTPGASWPAGSLALVRQSAGNVFSDVNQFKSIIAANLLDKYAISVFLQMGLGVLPSTKIGVKEIATWYNLPFSGNESTLEKNLFSYMGKAMCDGTLDLHNYASQIVGQLSTYANPPSFNDMFAFLESDCEVSAPTGLEPFIQNCLNYGSMLYQEGGSAPPYGVALLAEMGVSVVNELGAWGQLQQWQHDQIFSGKIDFTTATLSDFTNYVQAAYPSGQAPPAAALYAIENWQATTTAGKTFKQYLLNDIGANWASGWTPTSLSADVKNEILNPNFFTKYSLTAQDLGDFITFMNFAGCAPVDPNLSTAFFNFGLLMAKGDSDTGFYRSICAECGPLWSQSGAYVALQNYGQGIVNSAFVNTGGQAVCDEAGAAAMESLLNIQVPALQDTLFTLLAFEKGKDPSSPDFQLAAKIALFAFAGQGVPGGWPAVWPSGSLSTFQAFFNNWFNPPAGSGAIVDPYLAAPGVTTARVQGLLTSLGLTNLSSPTAIDQEAQTAASYLQTVPPGSVDAKLFNEFIAAYQAEGSQQGKGPAPLPPPDYTSLLAWANPILANNFADFPGILPATEVEFINELSAYDRDPTMLIYADRNYIQDSWLKDPSHQDQSFQTFGRDLIAKINDFLAPSSTNSPPHPGETLQTFLSSLIFVNIPGRYPPAPPNVGLQFKDVTDMIANLKSFTMYPTGPQYPTYQLWESACIAKDKCLDSGDTLGVNLFQTLMDQFTTERFVTGHTTLTSPPTFWRDDPNTANLTGWMKTVVNGSWMDSWGTKHNWSDLSPSDQTAFNQLLQG